LAERKHQELEILTSNKIGKLSDYRSERTKNVSIVFSGMRETYLKKIYHMMQNEAEQLVAQGFHIVAFNMGLQEICFELFVNFLTQDIKQCQRILNF
jgi:hypothetical protein